MNVNENILKTIGNTPLVKLNRVTKGLDVSMIAKLESFNPGGSVKDRIGITMIEDAEKNGLLKPGDTIVEPTSGNTGIGLALAAIVKGYNMVVTIPDKMSMEKIDLLRSMGARVIVTPTDLEPDHPDSYVKVAEQVVADTPRAFMPNQYFNQANPDAHYRTTGPEIWAQTDGKIDIFVAGIGTGGTITGIGRYLKEKNPNIKVIGVDPEGSMYHHEFQGTKGEIHTYLVEGIGEDFMPSTLDLGVVDDVVIISDRDALLMTRRLLQEEGLLVGGSSGAAVHGAIEYAKTLSGNELMVVLLPDTGKNYLSKIFSDDWMLENKILETIRT